MAGWGAAVRRALRQDLELSDSVGGPDAFSKPTAKFVDVCGDFEGGVVVTAAAVCFLTWMVQGAI